MDPLQDLEEAIRHLEQSVRLSPGNPRYSALLGEAWLLRGDPDAAIAPLQNSLQRETHPRIACLMALALLRLDRHQDAEQFATAAITETAAFHRAYFIRAESRIGIGNRMEAVSDLREAVALAPPSETYRLRLAGHLLDLAFESSGDHARAGLEEAREVLEARTPLNQVDAWHYLLGCVLVELGEARQALRRLDDLTWPTTSEVALRRAQAHALLGETEDARTCLGQARVDPDLMEEADRMLDRLDNPTADAPDEPRPKRHAPRTELLTVLHMTSTEVLSMPQETDEATASELEMLQPSGTDENDPDSAKQIARTEELPIADVKPPTDPRNAS
ncbi:MAG: hypothetical protein CMJ83_16515 [Planctomycetes bacterium]|nr:hypothetical protein [Planctomycetota bacterium]